MLASVIFHWPGAADFLVGLNQSPAQILIRSETGDLSLGFTLSSLGSERSP